MFHCRVYGNSKMEIMGQMVLVVSQRWCLEK